MLFLYKQKTAYEMRISVRSSDVCSSDLRSPCRPSCPDGRAREPSSRSRYSPDGRRTPCPRRRNPCAFDRGYAATKTATPRLATPAERPACQPEGQRLQIGRASCRERVCQYV